MVDKPTSLVVAGSVYPKKYADGFCFAVLCCGYTLTDFPISIRLTSLALWQSNDCPSASKATLMNMDKYFMWIHYVRLHNHNKAKHNKTVCIFLGIYCSWQTIFASHLTEVSGFNGLVSNSHIYLYPTKHSGNFKYTLHEMRTSIMDHFRLYAPNEYGIIQHDFSEPCLPVFYFLCTCKLQKA